MGELINLETLSLRDWDNLGIQKWSFYLGIQPIWDEGKDWLKIEGEILEEVDRQNGLKMGSCDTGENFTGDDNMLILWLEEVGTFSDSVVVATERFQAMLVAGGVDDTQIEELQCVVAQGEKRSSFSLRPTLDSRAILR